MAVADWLTNDLTSTKSPGYSLMRLVQGVRILSGLTARGPAAVAVSSIIPRTSGNVPVGSCVSPANSSAACFGANAVTAGSIKSMDLPATAGGQTTISTTVSGAPFMANSLFCMSKANGASPAGEILIGETTAGGLTGYGRFSSGSFNPTTGALTINFASAPPAGTVLTCYDVNTSTTTPSYRNYLNAVMCKAASASADGTLSGPLVGWWGRFIDTAATVENAPNTCAGAGDGLWGSLSNTSDQTHPTYAGHQFMAVPVQATRQAIIGR
ncbi:hypothetical protein M2322_003532 [Rhodoblastus acidophilus]|uniref:hypothetical protein n=1 Tax=Rhodoblastus acidophilus TaxID=1074 RepID=UPI0022258903|nr:hypothetical protein [Rhodoblastus acidophilus]MCW2317967.1 hypothetical protein [Rhodoblastus acidophilus]